MYGSVVLGVEHHRFEEIIESAKIDAGVVEDTALTPEHWQRVVAEYPSETCRSPPGQPLNLTLVFPSCQLRFPGSFRRSKPHGGYSRHQGHPRRPGGHCGHTQDLGRKFLAAPRVPSRLPAFRPPRGKMNFTGDAQPRQIGIPTPRHTGSNLAKPISVPV